MKSTLILLAIATVSCGEIDMKTGVGVGEVRDLQPLQISVGEHLIYDQICAALTRKSQRFSSSLPTSLTFDVQEKDCDGKTVTFGSQQVRVESTTSGFQFVRQDTGGAFLFPTTETPENGVMKEVCGGAQAVPMIKNNGDAMWISTSGIRATDCPAVSGEQCVIVETGSKQGTTGNIYRIHTREIIRFNVNSTSGKYGYFTFRKKLADSNCDEGKNTESTVTLR